MDKKDKLLITGSIAYDSIETPLASEEYILGGSASYASLSASLFCPVVMDGIVGADFKESDLARLKKHGIDTSGIKVDKTRNTMFWRGKYHENFNTRETQDIQLNVYEDYTPHLVDVAKEARFVLLGNISPMVQEAVLDSVSDPDFVILDTMDLWINTTNSQLKNLMGKVDLVIMNDSEAKLLSEESNIMLAADKIRAMGAKTLVIKLGEYGSMLFHDEGYFTTPAYPVRSLHDPTGAGDSFAGALAGYICAKSDSSFETLKHGMVLSSAAASITVESFSCRKLEEAGIEEVKRRAKFILNSCKI